MSIIIILVNRTHWRKYPFFPTLDAPLSLVLAHAVPHPYFLHTQADYRSGNFPPVRAPWDYKRLAAFPADHPARIAAAAEAAAAAAKRA